MPSWLAGHEVDAVITVIALAALILSAKAERRVARLDTMSFPGVSATWVKGHKAGPRSEFPPLLRDTDELRIAFTKPNPDFVIADVKLTKWEDYWDRYYLNRMQADDGSIRIYVSPTRMSRSPIPEFLRVKVERRGGVQAACWQLTRVEKEFVS